jgi:8-oxo-dGTP pyrophosphatase MutT (NUDIX family)
MIDIVKDEVREEAGFEIENTDIEYLGKVFVSTQMNQYCRLYLAYVDRDKQKERKPENAVEAMASTEWVDYQSIIELSDWKAIAIVAKAKSQGVI